MFGPRMGMVCIKVLETEVDMHVGNISNVHTAAGRVYAYLVEHVNNWCDAWTLTIACETTAISTRISEVRHQVKANEIVEHVRDGKRNLYRIVRAQQ